MTSHHVALSLTLSPIASHTCHLLRFFVRDIGHLLQETCHSLSSLGTERNKESGCGIGPFHIPHDTGPVLVIYPTAPTLKTGGMFQNK